MKYVIACQAICTICIAVLFFLGIIKCRAPKAKYFIMLCFLSLCYTGGYLLEMLSPTYEAALNALRIRYVGVSLLGPFLYFFAQDYCNKKPRSALTQILWSLPGCASYVLFLSYPYSKLYYQDLVFYTNGMIHDLAPVPGILFYPTTLYLIIAMLAAAFLVLRHAVSSTGDARKRNFLFLFAICLPSLASILYLLNRLDRTGVDFITCGLAAALVILSFYALHFHVPDWMSHAREEVLEKMEDSYILVDRDSRYLDANQKAKEHFPFLASLEPGSPLTKFFPLVDNLFDPEQPISEFPLSLHEKTHYMHASKTPILYQGQHLCTAVMMFDITQKQGTVQALSELAQQDGMTGLLNHNAFLELASRQFVNDLSMGHAGSLLMIDIDWFKRVNDAYGHLMGDETLRQLADALRQYFRTHDICARYGGEELSVYLSRSSMTDAIKRAEGFRKLIEEKSFPYNDVEIRITISLGVSGLNPGRHQSLEDLIADADSALYLAKRSGRNKVCAFSDQTKPTPKTNDET